MTLGSNAGFEWREPLGAWRWALLAALASGAGACGCNAKAAGSDIPALDLPCDGAQPFEGGLRCDGGVLHREATGACSTRWSPLESISFDGSASFDSLGGFGCHGDDQCTAAPDGHCVLDETLPTCHYGCLTDADCGTSQLCLCSDVGGICVTALCHTDAECGRESRCVGYEQCRETWFTCESPSDQCQADADCPGGADCVSDVSTSGASSRVCRGSACVIVGRPFLIGGAPRCAPRAERSDWRSTIQSAPAASRPLAPELRTALARGWTEQALMEHASVAAFARFALQLMALGAPAELVAAAAGAMQDEIRHAQDCFALARRYADGDIGPGPLNLAGAREGCDLAAIVLGAVREGCVGETLAALEAAEALQHCEDAAARPVLERIAFDEARHAELAWRFVAWALQRSRGTPRASELHGCVRAAFDAELVAADAPHPIRERDRELARHGQLSAPVRLALRARALRAVVAPCAAALLDSSAGARDAAQRFTTAVNSSSGSPILEERLTGA